MTDQTVTTGLDRPDRDSAGRFKSGNPGRPRGCKHAALIALDAIGQKGAEAALQAVVAAAGAGDLRAAEILLARVWPARKGRLVALPEMPAMTAAADLPAALGVVAQAVAAGDLTPDEGQAIAALLEIQRRAIETEQIERRLTALEKAKR